jgi:hypothetical protein
MTSKNWKFLKFWILINFLLQKSGLQAIAADSDNQTITNQRRSFSEPNTYTQKQIGTNFKNSHTVSCPMVTDNPTLDEKEEFESQEAEKTKKQMRTFHSVLGLQVCFPGSTFLAIELPNHTL